MLKRLTAILLLCCIITANFSFYFVYAGFELNKKYIATQLCENRDKPYLHCNGKCYFMKKIKQAADAEKKQAERDGMSRLEITFFQTPLIINFQQPVIGELSSKGYANYTYQYSSHYIETIFRPPKSVA